MSILFGISVFVATLLVGFLSSFIDTIPSGTIIGCAIVYGVVSWAFLWLMEVDREP